MLDFYGLREQPFSLLPNPRFMYPSKPYLETKAKLLYFRGWTPPVSIIARKMAKPNEEMEPTGFAGGSSLTLGPLADVVQPS